MRESIRRAPSRRRGKSGLPILDGLPQTVFERLRAWRREVARERNVPAYVIFQDATLAEIARLCPHDLASLGRVSGVGDRKLAAYGASLLEVLSGCA